MIERRHFLTMAGAMPLVAGLPSAAVAARPDLTRVPTRRVGPIERLYRTPHGKPNGLDLTSEGMWIMDQGPENYISLVNPDTGGLIREFRPQNVRSASGIVVDDRNTMWVGSTYNRFVVNLDPSTGRTIAVYHTPGAGRIYSMKGDVPGRSSKLEPAYPAPAPPPSAASAASTPRPAASLGPGQVALDVEEAPPGTGAHCILAKGDLLYIAVPPARQIFVVDRNTWQVQDAWATAGNRPHDMTWTDASKTSILLSDSNMHAFHRHDAATGVITETLQLVDDDWVVHGAKLRGDQMYVCDDRGWMGRFRI